MRTRAKTRSHAFRPAGLWCIRGGAVSLVVALVTGFMGMAHKDECLPLANHCREDLIQNALIVLYFGSLIVLAACVVVGLMLAAIGRLSRHR